MSQHVVFLEQALSDLSHHGDVQYRKKRETEDDNVIVQKTDKRHEVEFSDDVVLTEPSSPGTELPLMTIDDSLIIVRQDEPHVSSKIDSDANIVVADTFETTNATINGKDNASVACGCNMLHEYSCPIDTSKTFDHQFNDWYHNLLFSMSQNCSQGAKEFAARNQRTKHFQKHHNRPNRNIRHGVVSNDRKAVTMNSVQMDEMEHSLVEEEYVYATCDVIPNRHISLILQQNVKGRVNLWQKSDGHGPMQAHVQLSGFRVTVGDRKRRETNLMPVKSSSETSTSPPQPLEHGLHVHATGDLSRSCQSTGTHFNPSNSSHGGPMDSIRHIGDLGNIRITENGTIDAEYSYPYTSLVGQNSIIGKSLVVSMLNLSSDNDMTQAPLL